MEPWLRSVAVCRPNLHRPETIVCARIVHHAPGTLLGRFDGLPNDLAAEQCVAISTSDVRRPRSRRITLAVVAVVVVVAQLLCTAIDQRTIPTCCTQCTTCPSRSGACGARRGRLHDVCVGRSGYLSCSHRVTGTGVEHLTKLISGRTCLVDRQDLSEQVHVVILDRRRDSIWIKWMCLNPQLVCRVFDRRPDRDNAS